MWANHRFPIYYLFVNFLSFITAKKIHNFRSLQKLCKRSCCPIMRLKSRKMDQRNRRTPRRIPTLQMIGKSFQMMPLQSNEYAEEEDSQHFCIFAELIIFYTTTSFPHQLMPCTAIYIYIYMYNCVSCTNGITIMHIIRICYSYSACITGKHLLHFWERRVI